MAFEDARILSRPLGVEWSGWRSDTLELQSRGWRLAVSHDMHRDEYQLLMKNEQFKLYGISGALTIHHSFARIDNRYDRDLSRDPVFIVRHVAPEIMVIQAQMRIASLYFQEIDATPQYVEEKIISLSQLNVFSTKQTSQILVDKADMSVIEHLEAIKRLQSPQQAELRKRALESREELPRIHLVANLVHYAA